MDEENLIEQAKAGDVDAFNRLVAAYQSQVYGVAYRIMGTREAAEDVSQEAFISAYRNLRAFRGGSFRSWILRTVTNQCLDTLRYHKRRPALSLEEMGGVDDDDDRDFDQFIAGDAENPHVAAERSELRRAIVAAMRDLPPDQRITFVLADVQGLDYEEIAQVMDTQLGTVKSRLSRARARLRDHLLAQKELLPREYRPR